MNNPDHPSLIRALLFTLGRPLSRKELSQKLDISFEQIEEALYRLSQLQDGIALVDDGVTVELRTAPNTSALIEKVRKEEYTGDIGRAGLETLAAILYRGPLSRSEVDFIRGVNSSYILRTLLVRGLIRKTANPAHARSFLFEPTTELLAHLGLTHSTELPHYQEVKGKLRALEQAYKQTVETDTEV